MHFVQMFVCFPLIFFFHCRFCIALFSYDDPLTDSTLHNINSSRALQKKRTENFIQILTVWVFAERSQKRFSFTITFLTTSRSRFFFVHSNFVAICLHKYLESTKMHYNKWNLKRMYYFSGSATLFFGSFRTASVLFAVDFVSLTLD